MENKSPLDSALDRQFFKNNNVIDFNIKMKTLMEDIKPKFLESFNDYQDQITEILQNVDESVRDEVCNNPEVSHVISIESEKLISKWNLTDVKQSIEKWKAFDDLAA